MICNQPHTAPAASSNSSAPARIYLATQTGAGAGAAGGGVSGEQVEPEVRRTSSTTPKQSTLPPIVMQAVIGVNFIADHLKQQDEFNKVYVVDV